MEHKEKHIQNALKAVSNKNHKKTLTEYISIRKEIDRVTNNTIDTDVCSISHLSTFLKNKKFKDADRKDIRTWLNWLTKQGLGDTTINLYKARIKRFYKYISKPTLYEGGKADQKDIPYPDSVRWISIDHDTMELPLDSILNEKQIKKLYNGCRDLRDKVIVTSWLDAGLRRNELRLMKIKNVGFDKQLGAYFILPKKSKRKGLKTGARKVQLFLIPSSTYYIREHLNYHPFKDDPEAPFIYTIGKKAKNKRDPVSERGFKDILDQIVVRSGLKMHISPHVLRHNSATMCCVKGFNEFMLRERFGWSKSSNMPSRYVHLAQTDMSNQIKKILGITDEEDIKDSILQPVICWNCNTENPPEFKFCGKCSANLNPTKNELQVTATEAGVGIQKVMKNNITAQDQINQMLLDKVSELTKKLEEIEKKK